MSEDRNAEASDVMAEIDAGLEDTKIRARLRSIGVRIDGFDFDEALKHLNTSRETMES